MAPSSETRIGLFLDYENLAIGSRDFLRVPFDYGPVADAIADRGRVLVRKAYADWAMFGEDRKMLTRHHVELIEIPQRLGAVRKNAADIKLAVDAIELAFQRDYIETFVIGTGDSDFTPLVHKLREFDKRVIGFGVEKTTSRMLPPACDEFLFYDRLVDPASLPTTPTRDPSDEGGGGGETDLTALVVGTITGLLHSGEDSARASSLKRAILRKDPTFRESDHGYRSFGELLRRLEEEGTVELEGKGGDPVVTIPTGGRQEQAAMDLLRQIVADSPPKLMSGLKNEMLKVRPEFNERRYGHAGFLQFCKAAAARGFIDLQWDEAASDYLLRPTP